MRHTKSILLLVLLSLEPTACVLEPAEPAEIEGRESSSLSGDETYGPLPADADLAVPPGASLYFGPEWRESASGPLYHGARIAITADASRFPSCGTAGRVTASVRVEGGEILAVQLDEGTAGQERRGSFVLPSSGDQLEIWLSAEAGTCTEWDSQFGSNYRFELRPWLPARVRFSDDWSETVEGSLVQGGELVLDYDWDRLPWCRIIYRGFPCWDIIAHVRFDGREVPGQSVVRPNGPSVRERVLAVFPVPEDASQAEVWFENDQYPPTCQAWDSDFGRNYWFDISPR